MKTFFLYIGLGISFVVFEINVVKFIRFQFQFFLLTFDTIFFIGKGLLIWWYIKRQEKDRNFLFFFFILWLSGGRDFPFSVFFACLWCKRNLTWFEFLWKETNFTDIYCVIESKRIFFNAQFLVMTKIEFRSGIWVRRGQAFALFLPLSESMRLLKTLNVTNPCKNSIEEKKRRSAKALKTFYSNFLTNFLTNFLLCLLSGNFHDIFPQNWRK